MYLKGDIAGFEVGKMAGGIKEVVDGWIAMFRGSFQMFGKMWDEGELMWIPVIECILTECDPVH